MGKVDFRLARGYVIPVCETRGNTGGKNMLQIGTRAALQLSVALVFITLIVAGATAEIPATGQVIAGMSSVDEVVRQLMDEWNVPGMAVAIVKHDRLVFARGYGYADQNQGTLVQPDSLFRIASVSKPVTAVAILNLVEQDKLSLADKAFDILGGLEPPPGSIVDSRLASITIEHLLTHCGGWDIDQLGYDPQFDLHRTAAEALEQTRPASAKVLVRYMMGERLNFTPGSRYAYSNLGYNVLGRIIEQVTGQGYESYVKSEILGPMGITGMQIGHTHVSQRANREVQYYGLPGGRTRWVFPGSSYVAWPDGGWYLEAMDSHGGWIASVIDMMRFITHVDGRPKPPDILEPSSLEMMTKRPSIAEWQNSDWWYAFGWLVNKWDNWWHVGSLDGTTAILVRASWNDLSWFAVANFRPRNFDDFNLALDQAMWDAVNGVMRWPSHDLFEQY